MSDSTAIGLHHEAQHRPELLHHFADEQQQRNAASLGMWWFLGTEIMFFGGMFCAYLIYRMKYFPEFAVASKSFGLPSEGRLIIGVHAHRLRESKLRLFVLELQHDPVRIAGGFDTQNSEPVSTELHFLGQAA